MPKRLPPEVRAYLRAQGEKLGKKYGALGAATTNAQLTPEQRQANATKAAAASVAARMKKSASVRSEQARTAARARWAKAKEGKE